MGAEVAVVVAGEEEEGEAAAEEEVEQEEAAVEIEGKNRLHYSAFMVLNSIQKRIDLLLFRT